MNGPRQFVQRRYRPATAPPRPVPTHPPEALDDIEAFYRRHGVADFVKNASRCRPHAGETVGVESVTGALALGAHRLAHGVRSVEDRDVLARLAGEGVACDVCPTSNLELSVVADLAEIADGVAAWLAA